MNKEQIIDKVGKAFCPIGGKEMINVDFALAILREGIEEAFAAGKKEGGELERLIEECVDRMTAMNGWDKQGQNYFELAPNINSSGEIGSIGKVSEWRVSWSYGANLDDIEWTRNYFGKTPFLAVRALRELLK